MNLTGWQTVAITIGGAAFTAASAFGIATINGRQNREQLDRRLTHEREQQAAELQHERTERWLDRQIRAADDFSTGLEQALLGVRDLILAVAERGAIEAATDQ